MLKLQEKYVFEKESLPDDFKFDNKNNFKELFYYPDKSARINALLFTVENPKGIVFYNHGNAGTLDRWQHLADEFVCYDYDVLIYDYRQYGKSKGKLSEKALYNDALFIYDKLKKDYSQSDIVVYGRSLGTGIAAHTASLRNPKALILETPYYSLLNLIHREYFKIPSFLLEYHFRTDLFLPMVKCPIYIFHGTEDEITNYNDALKLKRFFKPGDEFITIEGGMHSGLRHYDKFKSKLKEILT